MATADDVRRVGLALPRTREQLVRGRWKLKVGQIVYVAFSADERTMGFGYPRAERDGLVASDPETFFLPPPSDLRHPWVCAHLSRLDATEMRELVVDAWRLCVPRMLHELPELAEPAARVWDAVERREWADLVPLLDPAVVFTDRDVAVTGRDALVAPPEGPSDPATPDPRRGAGGATVALVALTGVGEWWGCREIVGRPTI